MKIQLCVQGGVPLKMKRGMFKVLYSLPFFFLFLTIVEKMFR